MDGMDGILSAIVYQYLPRRWLSNGFQTCFWCLPSPGSNQLYINYIYMVPLKNLIKKNTFGGNMASISSFLRMFKNKNTWKPWPNFSGFHAWDSHGWCRLSRPSWYHERQQGPQHRDQGEVQAYWIIFPGIRKHMVFEAPPSWAQFWILSFIRNFLMMDFGSSILEHTNS